MKQKSALRTLLVLVGLLAIVLTVLFNKSFQAGQALFANDGPYALQKARAYEMPGAFFGIWNDLYWLGANSGNFMPNVTGLYLWLLGPLGYINFSVPLSLMLLGLCAAFYFQQLGFNRWVCVVGGMAAALNSNFFSNACWGLPSRALCLAAIFLSLAALHSSVGRWTWIKVVLAGFAVGFSISEGGDNGGFFALFVAAFAVMISLKVESGSLARRLTRSFARTTLTALCAAVLAAQTLNIFANLAVKGIVGTAQDAQTKEQKWIGATLWSLPKAETLRVIIPGLHGFRMDTAEGGNYWGGVGAFPDMPATRSSGAGEYAGVIVVLIAAFAFAQSLSKGNNPFTGDERKLIWFWAGAALVALLFAWGRFAPFYKLLYALPYFSTIRNPMKLMHPFHMALMILFAYGLQGLHRRYLTGAAAGSLLEQFGTWWKKRAGFERGWVFGCLAFAVLSVVGFVIYFGMRGDVAKYLVRSGIAPEDLAKSMAAFSAGEVGIYVLVLLISLAAVFAIQSGGFRGPRATWAAVLIGAILVLDLGRANAPWIVYYNYRERYASNPITDVLRTEPHTHRVTFVPLNVTGEIGRLQEFFGGQLFRGEWLQHHFQYYNIAALDVPQMPRMPIDYTDFNEALRTTPLRLWQLTNARYLLGLAGAVDVLNRQLDPVEKRFSSRVHFNLEQQGRYVVAVTNAQGPLALIEFAGALPRAKLYSRWQAQTNDAAALATLASPAFDPHQEVVVSEPIAPPANTNAPAPPTNAVTYASYSPRRVKLEAQSDAPAVLLLDDRYDPAWKVRVDGAPAQMLRCNYVVRGVSLPAGKHTVEFSFEPELLGFWVMLGCVITGLLLCVLLAFTRRQPNASTAS